MAPELQNTEYLYDIFYADKKRLITYLSQIDPNGVLTSLKLTDNDTNNGSTNIKLKAAVIGSDMYESSSVSQGFERVFDPAAVIPITVMNALDEKGFIGRDITRSSIGSLILSSGFLRIKDLSQAAEMWPLMERSIPEKALKGNNPDGTPLNPKAQREYAAELRKTMGGIFKSMEHPIQAEFRTDNGFLWSTLNSDCLFSSIADISLKHGSVIAGHWHVLGILDCFSSQSEGLNRSAAEKAWTSLSGESHITDVLHDVFSSVRTMFGRPDSAIGITPLIIFRKTPTNINGSIDFAERELERIIASEQSKGQTSQSKT